MDFHDGCPIVFRFPSGMSNVISLPVHWYPSSIQVASCILSDWPTKKPLVSCHLYTHHLSRCHQKYRKTYNLPEPLAHQLRLVNWMDVRTRLSSFSHRHTRAGKEVRSVWSCFDPRPYTLDAKKIFPLDSRLSSAIDIPPFQLGGCLFISIGSIRFWWNLTTQTGWL